MTSRKYESGHVGKRRSRDHFRLRAGRRGDDAGAGEKGYSRHADRAVAGCRRGSACRHDPCADRRNAGRAWPGKGNVCRRRVGRYGGAAVSFPRPRLRRIDRRVRYQPAQGRGALSLCVAVGAVQAGACRAAPYQGQRDRRGALLDQAHRPGADRRLRRGHRHQCRGRERKAARQIFDRRRWRQQHRAPSCRHRIRGFHLAGTLYQDRHQLRLRRNRAGLLHAQLFLRSRRVDQPVQGQRLRPARHLARRVSRTGEGIR